MDKIYIIYRDDEHPQCQCSKDKYVEGFFLTEKEAKRYCKESNAEYNVDRNYSRNLYHYDTAYSLSKET